MKKKILVTGGAGFIGSEFVRQAVKRGYRVAIIDKITYAGDLKRLREAAGRFKFYKADICDKNKINSIFNKEKPKVVVHFAAESVSKDTYLPVCCGAEIRILTLAELFNKLSKNRRNKIIKKNSFEVINLSHTNYKVISYKGGIGYWMPVKQISRHKYSRKIIKLSQKWGEIEVTPNHSIYDINYRLTSPLRNPELLSLRNINHISKKEGYLNFHGRELMALLRILGAYITEGWTTYNKRNGCFHFGISNKNRRWIFNLKRDLELLGYNPNITITKDKLFQLIVSNKSLFAYTRKEAGFGSHNKFIPSFIFQLKEEFQKEFLKTIIFGDGEIIKNKSYDTNLFTTTSKKMATGLSLLLTLLKQNYSLSTDDRFNAYTFRIGGDFTISLLAKKYKKINYNDYVYDISVANLQNFVCGIGNIVVHNTHVDRSIQDASSFIETNVKGTQVLLDISKKYKLEKFLHISTDEVYGEIKKGKFREDSPLKPNSPYAASKAAADLLIGSYVRTYGFPAIIIRPCNNYGPWQYPEKLIPVAISRAIENKTVPVYAKGLNVREWLCVADCAEGVLFLLKNAKLGQIYNLGSGHQERNIGVVNKILKILGRPNTLVEFTEDRLGHDWRYALNSSKVRRLGWKPKIGFIIGLKIAVEWNIANRKWLKHKLA
ncbi:MAG: NAD-dependent epimerase/dehydratase family protein [Candidatus Omnitrophica bacterium]|nr:NAD-dependent epimerase/dehydratase family protein [Candidatus Omnitrophota bacterium]